MHNKLIVKFSNERLLTPSGLSLVGSILGKSKFVKKLNHVKVGKDYSEYQIKNGDILLTYIGLLTQGKTSFESVNEMKDDPEFYRYALGIFWTNLDWTDEEVIACYHAHGECEQYHSEIKTDILPVP